jgi:hypothetical protein
MLIKLLQACSHPLTVTQEIAATTTARVPPLCQQPQEIRTLQPEETQDRETEPVDQQTASTSKIDKPTSLRTLQPEEAQDQETEPVDQQTASTSKIDKPTSLRRSATAGLIGQSSAGMSKADSYKTTILRRKVTKTASSSSLNPRPSTTVGVLPQS